MSRLGFIFGALAIAALVPASAEAGVDEKGRPFGQGTFQPSVGLGASFGGPLSVVNLGVGARYFIINGLGPGLTVSDTILLYDETTRAEYPGIASQTPTNIVRVMPNLQWVFVRTRRFSPYAIGGVGPVFYNNGGGVVGSWLGGGGALIGLGQSIYVDLGVTFTNVFPRSRCRDAFTFTNESGTAQTNSCEMSWGPRLGLTIAFGGTSKQASRRDRRKRERRDQQRQEDERQRQAQPEPLPPEPFPSEAPPPQPVAPPSTPQPEAAPPTGTRPLGAEDPSAQEPATGPAQPEPSPPITESPDTSPPATQAPALPSGETPPIEAPAVELPPTSAPAEDSLASPG